jgi:hypothetical protein
MTTTPETPEPDAPITASPTPEARRSLGRAPLVAVIIGGVLAIGMIFGGGLALGIALPIGDDGGDHRSGLPENGFQGGDRPGLPGGRDRTNPNAPSAPNQNDTGTQDQSDEG